MTPSAPRLDPVHFHRVSLSLCALSPLRPTAAATAAAWHNRLAPLGIEVPLGVIHDLGWALSLPAAERRADALIANPSPGRGPAPAYSALCRELLSSTAALSETGLAERDDLLVVLLAHLLGPLCRRYARRAGLPTSAELPLAASDYPPPSQYAALAREAGATTSLAVAADFQAFLLACRLPLLTQIELIDTATLRLLAKGRTRPPAGQPLWVDTSALATPDLLAVFSADAADVRDIVRFSQDLLPAVFEPQRSEQRQLYPVGGHASLERRGSIDSLLGSELVFDDTLFLHRLSDGEALYYGRERPREQQPGAVQILVDASASMRGLRQVFARGLAWALGKRLTQKRPVSLRFFDGRLHEAQPLTSAKELETLLSLLSFRSTRGRNYQCVFTDLLREQRRPPKDHNASNPLGRPDRQALYILTHGECHVPSALMQDLAQHADLYAVFIMPTAELRLDYLPWLRGYQVIAENSLDSREPRRRLALDIIERAASVVPPATAT